MGSEISSLIFQPLLLSIVVTLMVVALLYRKKKCDSDEYGKTIFKIDMGIAVAVLLIAIIIDFMSAFEI